MDDPSICPKTRKRCDFAEVCNLFWCAADTSRKTRPLRKFDAEAPKPEETT